MKKDHSDTSSDSSDITSEEWEQINTEFKKDFETIRALSRQDTEPLRQKTQPHHQNKTVISELDNSGDDLQDILKDFRFIVKEKQLLTIDSLPVTQRSETQKTYFQEGLQEIRADLSSYQRVFQQLTLPEQQLLMQAGHLGLEKAIADRDISLAKQAMETMRLNALKTDRFGEDQFSYLHLSVEKGLDEIAALLLEKDPSLCLLKDQHNRQPFDIHRDRVPPFQPSTFTEQIHDTVVHLSKTHFYHQRKKIISILNQYVATLEDVFVYVNGYHPDSHDMNNFGTELFFLVELKNKRAIASKLQRLSSELNKCLNVRCEFHSIKPGQKASAVERRSLSDFLKASEKQARLLIEVRNHIQLNKLFSTVPNKETALHPLPMTKLSPHQRIAYAQLGQIYSVLLGDGYPSRCHGKVQQDSVYALLSPQEKRVIEQAKYWNLYCLSALKEPVAVKQTGTPLVIARYLLEQGYAHVNQKNLRYKSTPLSRAFLYRNYPMCVLLMRYGAKPTAEMIDIFQIPEKQSQEELEQQAESNTFLLTGDRKMKKDPTPQEDNARDITSPATPSEKSLLKPFDIASADNALGLERHFIEAASRWFKAQRDFLIQLDKTPRDYGIQAGGLLSTVVAACQNKPEDEAVKQALIRFHEQQDIGDYMEEADHQEGYNCLLYLASKGYFKSYRWLIQEGFAEDYLSTQGLRATQLAVLHRQADFLRRALRGKGLTASPLKLTTHFTLPLNELHLAILANDLQAVQIIFDHVDKAHISYQVPVFGSVLNWAILFCDYPMVPFLCLQSYAEAITLPQLLRTTDTRFQRGPLAWAAILGKHRVVEYLLEVATQDVTTVSESEIVRKAFYDAARAKQVEVVQLFFQYGFCPNAQHAEYDETIGFLKKEAQRIYNVIRNRLRGQAPQHYQKPDPKSQVYRNLVFQGGGMMGVIYPYALKHLATTGQARAKYCEEEHGDTTRQCHDLGMATIKRVAGTSAGAIFALGYALGLSPALLAKETDMDFGQFLDTKELSHLAALLTKENRTIEDTVETLLGHDLDGTLRPVIEASRTILKTHAEMGQYAWYNLGGYFSDAGKAKKIVDHALHIKKSFPEALAHIKKFNQTFEGLSEGKAIYDWLITFMERQGIKYPKTFTFGDLANFIKAGKTHGQSDLPYKHLFVVVTCLDTQAPIVLTSESSEYHDYVILDAIRASMSIPIAFTPWQLTRRSPTGTLSTTNHRFVDGGMLRNYPINEFDRKQFVEPSAIGNADHPVLNKATLGFSLIGKPPEPLSADYTLKDLIGHLVGIYYQVENIIATYEDKSYGRTILLDTGKISVFSFKKLSEAEKAWLDRHAKRAVKHYFFGKGSGIVQQLSAWNSPIYGKSWESASSSDEEEGQLSEGEETEREDALKKI